MKDLSANRTVKNITAHKKGMVIIMNEKEIAEIRRRFRADKSNITRICGCYVNEKKEIVSEFKQSLGLMAENETEEILAILKKTLSGTIGKNLINIEFTTQQVLESEEHKILMAMKNSSLEDDDSVAEFYQRVIESLSFEQSYLILLSCDKYDVFSYSKSGERSDDATTVFTYILCSICPVKMTKPTLGYYTYDNTFRNIAANSVVGSPELGFMFPCFDERSTNIYNSLYYTRNISDNHDEFVDSVFKSKLPMPAAVQKQAFQSILTESVSEDCGYEVVRAVHEQISDMIEEHKTNKVEEPLMISKKVVKDVLQSCGIDSEKVVAFEEKYDTTFGENSEICPQNIVDTKQFEVRTADITIKVNPERGDLIKTQIIDGTKYILIRAGGNVEVNGVGINIS